nr:hypothetical protein [Burkholderia gladioli]
MVDDVLAAARAVAPAAAQAVAADGAALTDEQIRAIENEQAKIPGATRDNLTVRTVRAVLSQARAAVSPATAEPCAHDYVRTDRVCTECGEKTATADERHEDGLLTTEALISIIERHFDHDHPDGQRLVEMAQDVAASQHKQGKPATADEQRAAFEAEVSEKSGLSCACDVRGRYIDPTVRGMWEARQADRASQVAAPFEIEPPEAGGYKGKLPALARTLQGQRIYSLGYSRGRKKGLADASQAAAPAEARDDAEEMRDAAMRTVQAMGLIYSKGSDRWRPQFGDAIHPDEAAIDAFSASMKAKMAAARAKGRSGWETCAPGDLSRMLREHVEKGDPRDVANFCMMLHHLGAAISAPADAEEAGALTEEEVERQYDSTGIHIGSGLPRATCPCGFCAKHRFGFNQGAQGGKGGEA